MADYVKAELPMRDLIVWVNHISDAVMRGTVKAVIEATEVAYRESVINAKAFFNKTPGRVRTGQIMNSIYRGFDTATNEGFIASRLAYAAIQEYGGDIFPKNANHLWVKNYMGTDSQFKRWVPRDFMQARRATPGNFPIFKNPHTGRIIAAYKARGGSPGQLQALFTLVDSVHIEGVPYMRPAVKKAASQMSSLIKKWVDNEHG